MSLRHVPLRGTGWSRNPTSSGVAQRNRNQRVRRRPLLQPHEKTIGTFRTHAFLASTENRFHRGPLLRLARGPFSAEVFEKVSHGRNDGRQRKRCCYTARRP